MDYPLMVRIPSNSALLVLNPVHNKYPAKAYSTELSYFLFDSFSTVTP